MTPELASPSPNYHTNERTFQLSTDLTCIAALHVILNEKKMPKYVLVKLVDPKVLWAVAAEATGARGWRIPSFPPIPCLKCEVGDIDGFAIYRVEVQPVYGSSKFHSFPSRRTRQ
ncbi:hypothetical protein TNCV_5137281 [Trichonephila clavipes]|nr:hypothetical protein TNCV_5137281 [Trichonephila clavipes]